MLEQAGADDRLSVLVNYTAFDVDVLRRIHFSIDARRIFRAHPKSGQGQEAGYHYGGGSA